MAFSRRRQECDRATREQRRLSCSPMMRRRANSPIRARSSCSRPKEKSRAISQASNIRRAMSGWRWSKHPSNASAHWPIAFSCSAFITIPQTGKYGLLITRVMQVAGIGSALALAAYIALNVRRERRFAVLRCARSSTLYFHRARRTLRRKSITFISRCCCFAACSPWEFSPLRSSFAFVTAGDRAQTARHREADRSGFEITWTVIPLLIFLGIFFWAADVFFGMSRPPANATEIYVVGKQWMWKVQHPDGRREINELHLPVGQPVKLIMTLAGRNPRFLRARISHQTGRRSRPLYDRVVHADTSPANITFSARSTAAPTIRGWSAGFM